MSRWEMLAFLIESVPAAASLFDVSSRYLVVALPDLHFADHPVAKAQEHHSLGVALGGGCPILIDHLECLGERCNNRIRLLRSGDDIPATDGIHYCVGWPAPSEYLIEQGLER